MSHHSGDRIDFLDGLRGFAAMLVVVSHFANRTMVGVDTDALLADPKLSDLGYLTLGALGNGGGQIGVMIFFALSAFLMFHLYFETKPTTAAVADFALGRVARIFPLYYLAVAINFVVESTLPFEFLGIGDYAAHMVFASGSSVLWTIAPELIFYLCFVALWLLMPKQLLLLALIAACFVGVANLLPVFGRSYTAEFFAIGCIVYTYVRSGRRCGFHRMGSIPVALFGLVVALFLPAVQRKLGIEVSLDGWQNLGHALFIILLFILLFECRALQSIFGSRPMRFLGSISFSVYLLHLLVLHGMGYLGLLTPDIFSFAAAIGAVILLSTVVFYGFENPSRMMIRSAGRAKLYFRKPVEPM